MVRGSSSLAQAVNSAAKDKTRKKSSSHVTSSDSDSSSEGSAMVEEQVKKRSRHEINDLQKKLAQARADEATLLKKIEEQKARNEQKLQELAATRNSYSVIYVSSQIHPASNDFFVFADAIAAYGDINVRPIRKAAETSDNSFHQRHRCPMADC